MREQDTQIVRIRMKITESLSLLVKLDKRIKNAKKAE